MENQRNFLLIVLLSLTAILYFKWVEFSAPVATTVSVNQPANTPAQDQDIPVVPDVVNEPSDTPTITNPLLLPEEQAQISADTSNLITVKTDLVIATINTVGGVIQGLELIKEPESIEQKDQGFKLLQKTAAETFIVEDGLVAAGQNAPNHKTAYQTQVKNYDLAGDAQIDVVLDWQSDTGVQYRKIITFHRDSYVVDVKYQINNLASTPWSGIFYGRFARTDPPKSGGTFGQLPSYTGGAIYTEADKYQKIDFDDIANEKFTLIEQSGWVAMLQHYFVGAWVPDPTPLSFTTSASNRDSANTVYRIGYKHQQRSNIAAGSQGVISSRLFLGPKQQSRLKRLQEDNNIKGLALTVDYGWLTFIADPLFSLLSLIHGVVGNWGWAIIMLTILIKALFYPLSAASYKSMAGMKKLQPRIQTLKDRYKDDRQKFQMEMMALYKKEKINPAGGCLPILIQIPVFIALYWVLLESVEIRQAPFALWLQDLSSPDPYYVLPVLMGLSMWAMQKLNPAPTDEIQKKVMAIMPIALTFLFLSFAQGLVLYWVVNNILSGAQQWFINKRHAV